MLQSYISYRVKAVNRHGLHSPFAYKFMEEVVRQKKWENRKALKKIYKELKKDKRLITLRDLGAGSRINPSNERTIGEIARNSATKFKDLGILQRTISNLELRNILELGSNLGIGTCALASAPNISKLISIEGDPFLAEIAKSNLNNLNLQGVIHCGSFENNLDESLNELGTVDFAYIDGNHRKEPTLNYFFKILEFTTPNSVLAFGDIKWSNEMEHAWEEIKTHPKVTMTMDFFNFGLVFFKSELSKEHFTIKY